MRTGIGYDIHKLVSGRKLIVGGIEIPFEKGAEGHSDGDVLIHALVDALLGACALGDIGSHFPDTDGKYKDADSLLFLKQTAELVKEKNYSIENIDLIVILEKPKLSPYFDTMKKNISECLGLPKENINLKAKTNEGLDSIGSGNGISAWASVLLA